MTNTTVTINEPTLTPTPKKRRRHTLTMADLDKQRLELAYKNMELERDLKHACLFCRLVRWWHKRKSA